MRQVLGAGTLGRPRGMGWGGRRERGSGWGTHVNPWLIHVNVWQKQLQYFKVISLQLINEKNKTRGQNLDPKIMEKGAVPNQSQEMIYGKQFCGCHIQANSGSLSSTENGNSGRFYFLGLRNHCGQ